MTRASSVILGRDSVAKIPVVAEMRREHGALMERPMVGTMMRGDPRIIGGAHHLPWRMGQYAAAMLAKRGELGADASGLDARFEPPATVIFTLRQLDLEQPHLTALPPHAIEIARFTVAAHVMSFAPWMMPAVLTIVAKPEGTMGDG